MTIFTKNTALSGTVTIDSKNNQAKLVGTSTVFTSIAANLDLIIINDGISSRKQVKEILSVDTNLLLTLESNTKIYGDGFINISSGSNTITISRNVTTINLIPNDIILYEYLNNNVESMIVSGSETTYTLNTVSSFFTEDDNLKNYLIYPYAVDVPYQVIRTYYNDP